MTNIAFLSSGCQSNFGKIKEIIAADRTNYRIVSDPKNAHILIANFCAMTAKSLSAFDQLRRQILRCKKLNPDLKIIAGGCIEGLSEKKDLSFADAVFHHQEEADVFIKFIGKEPHPPLSPATMNNVAIIDIAQGCNRRCSFCKVHVLNYMQLTSRPMEEILDLARQAIAKGITTIALSAENSTEWGIDLGTNLQTLIKHLLNLDGLRILDVYGLCCDEVNHDLLQLLKHHKIRVLQLEAQSLDDAIRENMNLRKNTAEVLYILDELSDKFLISNFMIGFPGHSVNEFRRELRKIRAHHLYYLTLDDYIDMPGLPSHEHYQRPDDATMEYYRNAFYQAIVKERQLLLKQLMHKPYIKASVLFVDQTIIHLYASHYTVQVYVEQARHRYRPGDIVRVKITGLHSSIPDIILRSKKNNPETTQYYKTMQYFDMDQYFTVEGKILNSLA